MRSCGGPQGDPRRRHDGDTADCRPTFVAMTPRYEVELPAMGVKFSSLPQSRQGRSAASFSPPRCPSPRPPSGCTTSNVDNVRSTHTNPSLINPVHFLCAKHAVCHSASNPGSLGCRSAPPSVRFCATTLAFPISNRGCWRLGGCACELSDATLRTWEIVRFARKIPHLQTCRSTSVAGVRERARRDWSLDFLRMSGSDIQRVCGCPRGGGGLPLVMILRMAPGL
jgi:hypothetical protein